MPVPTCRIAVGTLPQKGDYLVLEPHEDYQDGRVDRIREEGLATVRGIDGERRRDTGWFLNVQEIPGGSDLKYQASTVDVYPSWDAYFKLGNGFAERFKKVHPDMDINQTFENYEKLRTIGSLEMLSVEDFVAPAK